MGVELRRLHRAQSPAVGRWCGLVPRSSCGPVSLASLLGLAMSGGDNILRFVLQRSVNRGGLRVLARGRRHGRWMAGGVGGSRSCLDAWSLCWSLVAISSQYSEDFK